MAIIGRKKEIREFNELYNSGGQSLSLCMAEGV